MYNMFDEDNIDLEEQMYLRDIQEELEEENKEDEDDENQTIENEKEVYEYDLTRPFLDTQCTVKDNDKTVITVIHKKTSKIFTGIVVGKAATDKNKYLFNMSEVIDGVEGPRKNKIFNFSDIKKYKG